MTKNAEGEAQISILAINIPTFRMIHPMNNLTLFPHPGNRPCSVLDARVVARADGHSSAARGPPAALDILT